jgi:hypothetical protein
MATLYFNGAVDNNWATLGNWWTDATFTTPATSLPSSSDSVIASSNIASNSGSEPNIVNFTLTGYISIEITVTGMATFNEDSRLEEGTITGDCTFNHTSRHDNIGNIIGNCIFNDNSYLFALVDGNCIFNDNAIFKGDTSNNIVSGSITFNNNSKNITNITADNIVVNRKIVGIANSDILGLI